MKGKDFRLRFCWRLILLFLFGNLNASFFTAEVWFSSFGRLHSGSDLPLIRQNRPDTGLSVADPASPPRYQTLRATFDPTYTPLTIPTRELWMTTYQSQMNGTFLETLRTNLW